MTPTPQAQRAAQVILSGRMTVLQRRALADLLVTLSDTTPPEPSDEHFKIVLSSALDALAPTPSASDDDGGS